MNIKCRDCGIELNENNQVSNGSRNGKPRIRGNCRSCRSKEVMEWTKDNKDKRNEYIRKYLRKSGKVKEYPCLHCGKLREKTHGVQFCSNMCRFLKYVFKTDYCWLWKKGRSRAGYGKFCMDGKLMVASRISYILFNGPIGEDKLICHSCDNPPCVNPAHLWQGTNSENQIDSVKKGRRKKSFNKDHK
jgi:hypothetical protein